jgi:hypothetical protein
MIVAIPNTISNKEGNAKNNKTVICTSRTCQGESRSSVDELTQSTSSTKKILYALSTIQNSHRLKDERVSSLDKTAARTAETATIDLRSEAPFNLIEIERRLTFGPFLVSMP